MSDRLKEPSLSMFAIRQLRESRRAQSIIDISLNKLFQSMSIAYRQKLTSPKWNRFRGLKLRWKDKIRFLYRCSF
jgi:MAX-like protein X